MTKRQILITIATFILAFGGTFYIMRTFFPKQKVEKTNTVKDTLTHNKE
ncbi:hypothetical protein [Flavobacterium sp.]